MFSVVFNYVARILCSVISTASEIMIHGWNMNFHIGKFDLFGSEKWELANLIANRDWLIVTVLQATECVFGNSKELERHDSVHLSSVYTH